MSTLRSQLTKAALERAYKKLAVCDFLEPKRSKEEMFDDIKIVGRGWTEKAVCKYNSDVVFVKHYLKISYGVYNYKGKLFTVTLVRHERYEKGKLTHMSYGANGCSGRFDSIEDVVSRVILRNSVNFKDKSAIAVRF